MLPNFYEAKLQAACRRPVPRSPQAKGELHRAEVELIVRGVNDNLERLSIRLGG